jgi:dTDP-4-amino-4,6-dideoxygalactose transaminase
MSQLAINGGKKIRNRPFPQWPVQGPEEEEALLRALRSGKWWSVEGDEVARFEADFAALHGARHAIAVTSGTTALRLALLAIGIRAGDEVIVPSYTFLATATSVLEVNATPVFVDVDPEAYNLDPAGVEAAVTDRAKAILPVHFAGCAADMIALHEIAGRHGLSVIEDAAHAHAGSLRGKGLGSIGELGCFSFQASKNLNCGEGGVVLTSDDALAAECRAIYNFGRRPGGAWYEHNLMSSNYRMTEFQGAVLNAQMTRLVEQTERRERNADLLTRRLAQVPGIEPQRRSADETRKAYHLYLFRFNEEVFGVNRERFVQALSAEGIPASEGYKLPLYRQPIFALPDLGPFDAARVQDYRNVRCPVTERACAGEGAWLFHTVLLGDEQDVCDIADAFEKLYENRRELAGSAS